MDSLVSIYLQRSRNEVNAAKLLFAVSNSVDKKIEFQLEEDTTFYSAVISHSYYAIFYAAKAILLSKGFKTDMPDVHKKTFEEFKKNFVDAGLLDVELLKMYEKLVVRADVLLGIFKDEKWKRGHFTYQTIPEANKEPAEQSIQNAVTFLKNIVLVLEK